MRKDNEISNRNKDRQLFGQVLAKVAMDHHIRPWWDGGQGPLQAREEQEEH